MIHKHWLSLFLFIALFMPGLFKPAQANKFQQFDSNKIINELITKFRVQDSYAQDFIIKGKSVKRMYFKFIKDGKPYYTYRSEWIRGGQPYVYLFNVDGKYDYQYYPNDKIAYRVPTKGDWNESNYNKAKQWHSAYETAKVIGEDVVNGKECYILDMNNSKMCVWKKNGLQLDLRSADKVMYYDNFEFNLKDDLFALPKGVKIVNKK